MRTAIFGFSILLVLAPMSALSQSLNGFYAGLGVGYVDLGADAGDITASARAAGVTGRVTSIDDSGLGWKIFGGYQFNEFFGVELAYADLSDVEARFAATAPTAATINVDADAGALSGAVIGSYPLNREFGVFGKLGVHYWDVDATGITVVGGTTTAVNADDDGFDVLFGLGGNYNVAPQVQLRLEWERYQDVGSSSVGSDGDIDMFGGSVLYRFQ